jgi:putative flippase GtrA
MLIRFIGLRGLHQPTATPFLLISHQMNGKTQFVRFAAGGAVGTVVHYLTLVVLVEACSAPVTAATASGFAVGAITNYLIARHWVFRSDRSHTSALPRFATIALAGAVINTVLVGALNAIGLHYLLAQVVATGTVLVLNFLANRYWTFG